MIAEFPAMLVVLLGVLTFLGGIMGYCVAQIRVKRLAHQAIDKARREFQQLQPGAQPDLQTARNKIDSLRASAKHASAEQRSVGGRENALQRRAQQQAQRIKALEAQLAKLDLQKAKVQQDFANYKINKVREMELARAASESSADTDDLPTLSRRVEPASGRRASAGVSVPNSSRSATQLPCRRGDENALRPDMDIPTLAESELPDSVDELAFDLTIAEDSGAGSRG